MYRQLLSLALSVSISYGAYNAFVSNNSVENSNMNFSTSLHVQQDDVFKEVMKAIPTPTEIADLIKSLNTDYPKNDLYPAKKLKAYKGDTKMQALNLGVYSTDLGFASMFKKNTEAFQYLTGVKDVATELGLEQFFDAGAMKEAKDAIDKGSLTEYATKKIDRINDHLVDKKRQHIGVLMLTGGWLEAVHVSIKVYQKGKSQKLLQKIGDQKFVLDQLINIFGIYGSKYADVKADLQKLKTVFDKIEVETTTGETKTVIKDGEIQVVGGTTQVVKITPLHVAQLTRVLEPIRSSITK